MIFSTDLPLLFRDPSRQMKIGRGRGGTEQYVFRLSYSASTSKHDIVLGLILICNIKNCITEI